MEHLMIKKTVLDEKHSSSCGSHKLWGIEGLLSLNLIYKEDIEHLIYMIVAKL